MEKSTGVQCKTAAPAPAPPGHRVFVGKIVSTTSDDEDEYDRVRQASLVSARQEEVDRERDPHASSSSSGL